LQEDKAAKELKLADLTAHCTAVQMLKFGQVIDAHMLDGIGVRNKTADELREVLKGQVRLVMLVVLLAVCVCGGGWSGCWCNKATYELWTPTDM
jgi:hypothetical protein